MAEAGNARTATASMGVVFLVLFLDLVGFSIVFPLYGAMMDYYQAQDAGLFKLVTDWIHGLVPHAGREQQAAVFGGLLAAIYSGIQFVVAPMWGRLSDRIGRRPVLLLSIFGTTTAYALWIFANHFIILLISRVIAGVMTGNVSVANAAVADISTPQTRSKGMAFVGMAFGLGFILGPAIGGFAWIIGRHTPGLWPNPFAAPALVACALSAINLAMAVRRFKETLPPERRVVAPERTRTINPVELVSPALGPGVARINLAFLLHTLLFAGMEVTLVFLSAQRLGFTPAGNAGLFCWMGLLSAAIQGGVFRRMVGRIGPKPLTVAGLALMIPGFLAIALVDPWPHTWLLVLATTILAGGTGLVFPGLSAMASLAGDARRQGWVMGTFRSAGSLGRAVGPLLGALTYFVYRPAGPYLVCAAGMLIPVAMIATLRFSAPPSEAVEAA